MQEREHTSLVDARINASMESRPARIGLGVTAMGGMAIAAGFAEGIINRSSDESLLDSVMNNYITAGGYLAVPAGLLIFSIAGIRAMNRFDRERTQDPNQQLKLF